MIQLPETKEEILKFIDNLSDLNSPEGVAFKSRVNTDPDYKKLVREARKFNGGGDLKGV